MRTASPKLNVSHLTANERALLRCQSALEFKDRGDYDSAQHVMRPLWRQLGERPETTALRPAVAAEVVFCIGVLTGLIGSKNEIKEADDWARDLLTESLALFESLGDSKRLGDAQSELGYCYWRAGALDEARVMFTEALHKLTTLSKSRANAVIGLSVVDWSSLRYVEALKILTDNAPMFNKITDSTTKGTYHNQLAMILRKLVTSKNKTEQLSQVINEYKQADACFKVARNTVFRAHVKNNIGNILRELSRFTEAHEYLGHARQLLVRVRDKVRIAQVDETRAQVFLAEQKYSEAEVAARSAVRSFEKAGRQCFLAEALITYGLAMARLGKTVRAQFTFQKAIEVAHQAGSLNVAGLAALTLIEEVDNLAPEILSSAYEQAKDWLASCQSEDIESRLKAANSKLILQSGTRPENVGRPEILFNKQYHLPKEVLNFERGLIKDTLTKVNGSITHAGRLLGVSYQRLAYIIETRHKDLLKERSPVRRRGGKGTQ